MAKRTPGSLTPRVGFSSKVGASARRSLAGAGAPDMIYGDTVEARSDGKLEVRVPAKGFLKKTSRGLELNGELGDKNYAIMKGLKDVDVVDAAGPVGIDDTRNTQLLVNAILAELRRTGRMR